MSQGLLGAFNGKATSGGGYAIGLATASNHRNWVTEDKPVITPRRGWESSDVKDPCPVWDGTEFTIFYAGYDNTKWRIGRATSRTFNGNYTRPRTNPILKPGTNGDPDEGGCAFPTVHYDPTDTPAWRMWYSGYSFGYDTLPNPVGTVCYADSTDGINWNKHGTVIGRGPTGSFNETTSQPGAVIKTEAAWYVYFGGFRGGDFYARAGYATAIDPASSDSYSAPSQLANYSGNIKVGRRVWQSNEVRSVQPNGGGYYFWISLWRPTNTSTILEACVQVSSPDLTSPVKPSRLCLPLDGWDAVSAENMSAIPSPSSV